MVIDSSALVAMLLDEPERIRIENAIEADAVRLVSAMTKLEVGMVMIGRHGIEGARRLDRLLEHLRATIVPFDEAQADIAREAFMSFGKGRHLAALNCGACASYALAASEGEPLLLKGTDFGATDIETVTTG